MNYQMSGMGGMYSGFGLNQMQNPNPSVDNFRPVYGVIGNIYIFKI